MLFFSFNASHPFTDCPCKNKNFKSHPSPQKKKSTTFRQNQSVLSGFEWFNRTCFAMNLLCVFMYIYVLSIYLSIHPSMHPSIIYLSIFICAHIALIHIQHISPNEPRDDAQVGSTSASDSWRCIPRPPSLPTRLPRVPAATCRMNAMWGVKQPIQDTYLYCIHVHLIYNIIYTYVFVYIYLSIYILYICVCAYL
jgi:hypothetical protein